MAVLLQIRAVTRRCAIQVHLLHQSTCDERIEAVVDRRQRDGRHMSLCPQKQLRRRRMISLLQQDSENFFSLPSKPDPIGGELMGNIR
jgi:hypothetical protein